MKGEIEETLLFAFGSKLLRIGLNRVILLFFCPFSISFCIPIAFLKKKKSILFIFIERGREGEREGEKHQCVVASHTPPTGHLVCNPDMRPDWELNRQLFGLQAGTQATELHQPGPIAFF